MKFADALGNNVSNLTARVIHGSPIYKGNEEHPCCICKEPTAYYEDVGVANHVCSSQCLDQFWINYNNACKEVTNV